MQFMKRVFGKFHKFDMHYENTPIHMNKKFQLQKLKNLR